MKHLSCTATSLLAVLLMASPAFAANATSDTLSPQDIVALKAQIAQLTKKVDQLEKQAKKTTATTTSAPAVAAASPASAAPAADVAAATAAVSAVSTVPSAATVSGVDVVTKGTFPGSFHVPGTETSVKIGGYLKADAIEDIGTGGYSQSFAHFYAVPLRNTVQAQQSSQTIMSAQQSRVNFETRTPSSLGEIRTFVEGDFFGSAAANSNISGYGFELRHAYGSVGSAATGQVLAGQTWSNFMDVGAMPESLDYLGPASTIFVRQPQVRYTHAVGPVTLSASVEVAADAVQGTQNVLDTVSRTSTAGTAATERTQMPDFVAHAQYDYASNGYVGLRGVVNQLNYDRTQTVITSNNDTSTKYGFGIAMSGKQGVLSKDSVNYDFVLGNGTGRYDYDVNASGAYFNTSTNVLKTTPYYGGTMGYQHFWSNDFRSNVFGGAVRLVNDTDIMNAATASTINKYVASGHANLIWQPVPAYEVGIEYMHGYRETETGVYGNLNRTEASFIYNF